MRFFTGLTDYYFFIYCRLSYAICINNYLSCVRYAIFDTLVLKDISYLFEMILYKLINPRELNQISEYRPPLKFPIEYKYAKKLHFHNVKIAFYLIS